jgi:alpha-ketoglutarate-dependent taurine dioxygenase
MVLANSQALALQTQDAAHQEARSYKKHQRERHLCRHEDVAQSLAARPRRARPPALFQCIHQIHPRAHERRRQAKKQTCE